ncbi:BPL/LPL catalytic domain-containing protein [Meloidogyne graminicola]|uniref:BPL/LPL catalytic domain-containing protein n=1 Tax=Meloidogyne graminicola TaxID=189291 RepID=A0A8S9ZEN1_9BILA|nr:BPL/LPL catalytic domain-containing protein [Meloidogyne graminicola]
MIANLSIDNSPKFLSIFSSASNCIYKNLALEEWLFRNKNYFNEDILLIWRNSPSVVIGRYQNPWIETNMNFCNQNKIKIVRRYSGGGAVYHDMGNFNISLLTSHNRHNRKENLKRLSKQDDLIVEPNNSKISGTAARISNGKAYHHFTLLVNPNMMNLHLSLQSSLKDNIETTATKSIKAKSVGSLVELVKIKENKDEEIMKKTEKKINSDILPCEEYFPGIEKTISLLKSDDWIFNKTPKFRIQFNKDEYINVQNGIILESTSNKFPIGEHFKKLFFMNKTKTN